MRRKYGRLATGLVLAIMITTAVTACGKNEEVIDPTRTYEFVQDETTQKASQNETTHSNNETTAKETETSSEEKETTQKATETTKECAETYYGDRNSVFYTLPLFEDGEFVDYFNREYVVGIEFDDVTESEYKAYADKIAAAGTYTLNSKDTNRYYFESSSGIYLTLIHQNDTMLVELGKEYWDIVTYAPEADTQPTAPSETSDGRYTYFDNKALAASKVPYFNEGIFTDGSSSGADCELNFSGITDSVLNSYYDLLINNGFMFAGEIPGSFTYYQKDDVMVATSLDNSNLVMQIQKLENK